MVGVVGIEPVAESSFQGSAFLANSLPMWNFRQMGIRSSRHGNEQSRSHRIRGRPLGIDSQTDANPRDG